MKEVETSTTAGLRGACLLAKVLTVIQHFTFHFIKSVINKDK